ncbi:hypothetical protein ABTW96_05030 [Nocardia beijingensis]|uniref:VWA domain-containing protein n=1 Tax=Nocardia beijingensis TaxID=95162 RepID=UPI00332030D9
MIGDRRTNRTDPKLAAVQTIIDRAKHTYWLNPEPSRSWSTGDSAAHVYAEYVTMHECRNVKQLTEVVAQHQCRPHECPSDPTRGQRRPWRWR